MKGIIKKIIYNLPIKKLLRNYIILESNPEFADSTYYIFQELLNQKINNNHKLIWLVKDRKKYKNIKIKNVTFIDHKSISRIYYMIFSKYIIDSNNFVYKHNKHQFRVYLGHGMPIKMVPDYFSRIGELNYCIVTSNFFCDYYVENAGVSKDKLLPLGLPRNDQFYFKKEYFGGLEKYSKIIIWVPTYRKHVNGVGYGKPLKFGIPSINNKKELEKLNSYLCDNNTLLIVKLHPVEDTACINNESLGNILFTKNELLEKYNKNIYQLLQLSDALITDYSSLYFDYLLMNKPIGMSIEDLNEYKKVFGVYFNDFEQELPAEYIYNYDDLCKFIDNIINNKDIKNTDRNNKKTLYFKYIDGSASKRVVKLLIDNMF